MTNLGERRTDWVAGRAALISGGLGLVAGFVRGLFVYAPTAWAAAFEVSIPAAAVGVVMGLGIVGVRNIARPLRAHQ